MYEKAFLPTYTFVIFPLFRYDQRESYWLYRNQCGYQVGPAGHVPLYMRHGFLRKSLQIREQR